MDSRRLVRFCCTLLTLYVVAYALLYQPNSITTRVGRGEPVATYRVYSRWFDVEAFFSPLERIHYVLNPERHKHLAQGLDHFVAMGRLRPEWWKRRW